MYLTTSVKFGIKGKLRLSADRFGIMPRIGGFRGKKTSCRLNDFTEASHFTETALVPAKSGALNKVGRLASVQDVEGPTGADQPNHLACKNC